MVLQGSVLAKKTDGDWSRDLRTCDATNLIVKRTTSCHVQRCGTVDDGHTVSRVFMPLQNKISLYE